MKRVSSWTTHEEAAREEGRYWRSVSVEERVSAVETIRKATIGIYGSVPSRLARSHRLIVLALRALPEWRKFAELDRMATLGEPPLRVDIMTSISGVTFREAWRGRLAARADSYPIAFLGERELRRNKQASGRPKDQADLALLDEVAETAASPATDRRRLATLRPRPRRLRA